MAVEKSAPDGIEGDRSRTARDQDDEPEEALQSFPQFLRGERTVLWPVWVLFLIMVAVIVWDSHR